MSTPTRGSAGGPPAQAFRIVSALVLVTLIVPVWVARVPALSDFVNHVARIHVLAHYGDVPQYQAFYEPAWGPYPNLAFDIVGVPLAKVMSALTVGKVFLTLTLTAFWGACLLLGQSLLGRRSWRSLVACFFAWNESFLFGYCNFTFGVAMAVIAIALFARYRDRPPTLGRSVGVAAVALVAAVSHAAAIVTMAMALAGFVAGELIARRRRGEPLAIGGEVARVAPFVPAGLYFVSWMAFFADHSADRAFSRAGPSTKLLLTSMLPSFVGKIDLAVLGLLALIAAAAIALQWPARVRWPALGAALMLTLAVYIAPADFAGSYEANGRYVLGAWLFALFAVDGREGVASRRAMGLALAAVALLMVRQVVLAKSLRDLGREMDEQIALLDHVPEGAHLGNMTFLDGKAPRAQQLRERAILHATSYAAISRKADVPTLYAIRGVQPLRHKAARYDLHRFKEGSEGPFEIERIRAELDAVWLCRAPASLRDALAQDAESLGKAGPCELLSWKGR